MVCARDTETDPNSLLFGGDGRLERFSGFKTRGYDCYIQSFSREKKTERAEKIPTAGKKKISPSSREAPNPTDLSLSRRNGGVLLSAQLP
jgi:hypothetical protein